MNALGSLLIATLTLGGAKLAKVVACYSLTRQ